MPAQRRSQRLADYAALLISAALFAAYVTVIAPNWMRIFGNHRVWPYMLILFVGILGIAGSRYQIRHLTKRLRSKLGIHSR
jgi:divalent metal cation (Fe/Co/Zn/Cd) transporter